MPTSAIPLYNKLKKPISGFTLIELLVVLVLLGLVLSLTIPNIMSWFESRERAVRIEELVAKVQHLPLKASTQNKAFILFDGSELDLEEGEVSFTPALEVLANGYCKGASATFYYQKTQISLSVQAPFCLVTVLQANAN